MLCRSTMTGNFPRREYVWSLDMERENVVLDEEWVLKMIIGVHPKYLSKTDLWA